MADTGTRPAQPADSAEASAEKTKPRVKRRAPQRKTRSVAQAAERRLETRADTAHDTVRADTEFLHRSVETAQETAHASLEAGARSLETLTESMTRAFVNVAPGGAMRDLPAQDIMGLSRAGTVLVRAIQESSRVWLEIVEDGARKNLGMLVELAGCRSPQDVAAVQGRCAQANLQGVIDGGQRLAQVSAQAMVDASQAMQAGRRRG